MKKLEPHPYCLIFPMMDREELWSLKADIRKHGQKVPIVLFEGKILDGRSRYDCVVGLNLEPEFTTFRGTSRQALQYAASLNLYRRHLNQSQKAAVAVEYKRQLVACGVPEQVAEHKAMEVTGASERTIRGFERIETKSPRTAKKIAEGRETVGRVEKEWAAPNPIDLVLDAQRRTRADARTAVARGEEAGLTAAMMARLNEQMRSADRLFDELAMLAKREVELV